MPALSPRTPAPKLRSTAVEQYGTPRRTQSVFQSVALSRGYTVRAGAIRRAKLENTKGVVKVDLTKNIPVETSENED